MSDDADRIARLELALQQISRELADLKSERAAREFAAAPSVSPTTNATPIAAPNIDSATREPFAAPPRFAPPPGAPFVARAAGPSIESLVGRYGALALAALTIVMGAGALVSWALRNGLLGPEARVALGALLAAALAGLGWFTRRHGDTRFSNVLLALALAVTHVVAWGAGPRLHLIPDWASLVLADVASVALAALALHDDSESLFLAGFGGALIAPFVTSAGPADGLMLAAYGVIVVGAGVRALAFRAWPRAVALIAAMTFLYATAAGAYQSPYGWITRELPMLVAGIIALVALAIGELPTRRWLSLAAVEIMALELLARHSRSDGGAALEQLTRYPDVPLAAVAATVLLFAAARTLDEERNFAAWVLATLVVPIQCLESVLAMLRVDGAPTGPIVGAVVLVWAIGYAAASLVERGTRRGALLAMSGLVSLWATTVALDGRHSFLVPAIAVHALLFAWVASSEDQPPALLATAASLLVGFAIALSDLSDAQGYTDAPFLSTASIGAAAIIVAASVGARVAASQIDRAVGAHIRAGALGTLVAAVLVFLWGRFELEHAFSRDASTFLSISYHAAAGVLAIYFGRRNGEVRLRQIGLALCVLAALMAVLGAWNVQQIGLRVGSYLAVGGFLLGVAWWYRQEQKTTASAQ